MRHGDRTLGLCGHAVTFSPEASSPASKAFVVPTFPYVRQLNCVSVSVGGWKDGLHCSSGISVTQGTGLWGWAAAEGEMHRANKMRYFICACGSFWSKECGKTELTEVTLNLRNYVSKWSWDNFSSLVQSTSCWFWRENGWSFSPSK